jgi:hypothetical protein
MPNPTPPELRCAPECPGFAVFECQGSAYGQFQIQGCDECWANDPEWSKTKQCEGSDEVAVYAMSLEARSLLTQLQVLPGIPVKFKDRLSHLLQALHPWAGADVPAPSDPNLSRVYYAYIREKSK